MGGGRLEIGSAEDFAEACGQLCGLGGLDVEFGVASEVAGGDETVTLADLTAAFEEAVIGSGGCVFSWRIGAVVNENNSVEAGEEEERAEKDPGPEVAFRGCGGLGVLRLITREINVGHAVSPPGGDSQACFS